MNFAYRPLSSQIGAEITGLDLRQPIDADALARLRQVWLDHVIVLFAGQDLDDDQQIAFSRCIGSLELINMAALQVDGKPEVYAATNLDRNQEFLPLDNLVMQTNRDNAKWHSDSSFKKAPAMASLLHARIVPPVGGGTCFANMAAAYDALDEAMKERIEGLIGVHNFFWSRRGLDEDQIAFTEAEMAAIPPVRHPVARVHPETGRKAIYVGSHTKTIEGMAFDAARDLIEALLAHATQPEFVYEHQWRVGDLILWDNRTALHRGTKFDMRQHKRRLHRTTIAGTGPTISEDSRAL